MSTTDQISLDNIFELTPADLLSQESLAKFVFKEPSTATQTFPSMSTTNILQASLRPGTVTKTPEYKPKLLSRVSIPVTCPQTGTGCSLEMTTNQPGKDQIDFSLIIPGKQVFNFSAHRKDLEAMFSDLTLDKLAK